MPTTLLTPKTTIDLFDYRYGKYGTILYREGSNPPAEITQEKDGNIQKVLKFNPVEVKKEFFDLLKKGKGDSQSPLKEIAGKSLRKLSAEKPNLLVFP